MNDKTHRWRKEGMKVGKNKCGREEIATYCS
jgi:hypothetical protein